MHVALRGDEPIVQFVGLGEIVYGGEVIVPSYFPVPDPTILVTVALPHVKIGVFDKGSKPVVWLEAPVYADWARSRGSGVSCGSRPGPAPVMSNGAANG